MKLSEALATIRSAPEQGPVFEVSLACGFTPLHLANFLRAHLQLGMPDRKVEISTGLYDDLMGSVQNWTSDSSSIGVLILEWADLDPRLGFRSLGGWGQTFVPSIIQNVRNRLKHLASLISSVQSKRKIVLISPTLPLPPAFHTSGGQSSEAELTLFADLSNFVRDVSAHPAVVVASQVKLDGLSAIDARYDLRSDLNSGFPYVLRHADILGGMIAGLLQPPPAKKGLITDLDDTFWLGLVGEIGAANVCWDLSSHAQVHGLYQQMLQGLADQGVLVAVASKNSSELATEALERSDLAIAKDKLFPLEIHWEPKSVSVRRILKTWNIGASSVIFVDDSPIELEEVRLAHPEIECRLFPKNDPAAFLSFLQELRDLFGKPRLSEEDTYRLDSIRRSAELTDESVEGDHAEKLLAGANAVLTIDFSPEMADARLLDLVNKTNQFNLNGLRIDDGEWARRLKDPTFLTLSVQYSDQFGPLGKIAVLQTRQSSSELNVRSWVMSCRAFSRRIEFQTLNQLFEFTGADAITFEFSETAKNAPMAQFLASLSEGSPAGSCRLTREHFLSVCPPLYHQVIKEHE